jgi:hypothetical protein
LEGYGISASFLIVLAHRNGVKKFTLADLDERRMTTLELVE